MGKAGYDRKAARREARAEIEDALTPAPAVRRGRRAPPAADRERWAYAIAATRGPFGPVRKGLAALRAADPAAADATEESLKKVWSRIHGTREFLTEFEKESPGA
jgi:hypothetical protein